MSFAECGRAESARALILAYLIALPCVSFAADIPSLPSGLPTGIPTLDPSLIPDIDISALIPETVMQTLLGTIGIVTEHRPYQPATPLGLLGSEWGVEATLVHLPDNFMSSLTSIGKTGSEASSTDSATSALPALPMARLHVHKGIWGPFDVGASGIAYKGIQILGGDIKAAVYQPDEGLTWAVRFSYSRTTLDLGKLGLGTIPITISGANLGSASLVLKTHTIAPAMVVSKKIHFSDPYFGAGYEWTTGQMEIPIELRTLNYAQTLRSKPYRKGGLFALTGVGFRLIPIKIGIEGAWSSIGMHYFGAILGLCF